MSDLPPQAAPPEPGADMIGRFPHFDPQEDFDAQMIRIYGTNNPAHLVNGVHGTLVDHEEQLDQYGRRLEFAEAFAVDTRQWRAGADVFGQQQMALNATMTQAVTHTARRQGHMETFLTNAAKIELWLIGIIGAIAVLVGLWACSNSTGEDYAKNVVVTAALLAVFLIIALVVYFTGFKPLPADPQPAAAAPPADREARTEQQPVVRVDDRRPQA